MMRTMQYSGRNLLTLIGGAMLIAGCSIFGGGGDDKNATPTVGKRVPILSSDVGTEVDTALSSIAVILPPPTANRDWPMSGGNSAKNLGHVQLGSSIQRAWTASISGSSKRRRLASAPVIADGRLIVSDVEGNVQAFDASTGASLWTAEIEVEKDGMAARFGGGAAASGGFVYASNGVGDVIALKADDGSQIWKVRPAGPLRGSPTISNNNVYVMTQDNQVYALSIIDGAVQWNEAGTLGQAGLFGVGSPAASSGTVVAGFSSGELTAYRYENGRNLWNDALARTRMRTSVATLSDIDADPVIDRGRVFALGQGGRMASYELTSGQRIWELSIAGIATPVVAGEWVFILTDDAKLLCVARSTGKVRWIAQLDQWRDAEDKKGPIFWSGPVLAGNRLIVGSTEGKLVSVNPADGSFAEFGDLDQPISLPPIVANNMLYVLDDSGRITAFR